jgi:hypothetical protein
MESYRHTQPGTVVRWALLLGMLPLPCLSLMHVPHFPVLPFYLVLFPLLLFSQILLWSLTIEINPGHFKFWFGPGLIRKTIPLVRVESCEPVDGIRAWGIHWGGKRGWLYNVSGFRAVALTLHGGKRLMVGTDEPEKVCQAVAKAKSELGSGDTAAWGQGGPQAP